MMAISLLTGDDDKSEVAYILCKTSKSSFGN